MIAFQDDQIQYILDKAHMCVSARALMISSALQCNLCQELTPDACQEHGPRSPAARCMGGTQVADRW